MLRTLTTLALALALTLTLPADAQWQSNGNELYYDDGMVHSCSRCPLGTNLRLMT